MVIVSQEESTKQQTGVTVSERTGYYGALHDATLPARPLQEQDPETFYLSFIAKKDHGFYIRKEDGKIAIVVPPDMPEEVFDPIADYVEAHAEAIRHIIRKVLAMGTGTVECTDPAPAPVHIGGVDHGQSEGEAMEVYAGVLTDEYLYHMRRGKLVKIKLPGAPAHMGDVFQLCLTHDIETLWVLAGTNLSRRATQAFLNGAREQWGIRSATFKRAPGVEYEGIATTGAWKLEGAREQGETGREVYTVFPQFETDWQLDDIDNPITLLATVAYMEDAIYQALHVHIPIRFSPGNVGKEVMEQVNSHWKRAHWITTVDINQYAPVVEIKVPQFLWKRPLDDQEQEKAGVVAYDKNSQYPASCTGAVMGAGAPVHIEHPVFEMKDKPTPGVWYCHISGTSIFDGKRLPHPTGGKTEGWFWSYTVKLLIEVGYHVEITEAFVWSDKDAHTILRPFAERLWSARAMLKENTARYKHTEARKRAQKGMKLIMNTSLGWLDMGKNRDLTEEETIWYHRPDWRQLLIDNAHYQMYWRIRSYLKKGFTPIGVFEDCLYYAVDDLNHETALPGMMERAGKLGGFKRKYEHIDIAMSTALPLFNNPKLSIQQINLKFLALDANSEQEQEQQ